MGKIRFMFMAIYSENRMNNIGKIDSKYVDGYSIDSVLTTRYAISILTRQSYAAS